MDGDKELRSEFEKTIRNAVHRFNQRNNAVDYRMLRFGYIGNYGSMTWNSGVDDRKLIIWYGPEDKDEPSPTLWEHEAKYLDAVSYGKAIASIKAFEKGFDAGISYQQNHWESIPAGTRMVCDNKLFWTLWGDEDQELESEY